MFDPQAFPHDETRSGENGAPSPALARDVTEALDAGDAEAARSLILPLGREDQAELFAQLNSAQIQFLIDALGEDFDEDVLPYLPSDILDDAVRALGTRKTAVALTELESDDALHVIGGLPEDEQQEILDTIPDDSIREEIEEGLSYPDSSAGRLMRKQFLAVPEYWSVGDVIDFMRQGRALPEDFYVIFVTDPKFRPVGKVRLSQIMQSKRDVTMHTIMDSDLHAQTPYADQEEVAFAFRKYGLVEAPVIGEQGRLVGSITVDDVVDVMQEEQEEDLLRAAGVMGAPFHAGILETVRPRFLWLLVNLLTAAAAASIVHMYQETIAQLVLLAVLMPMVASMGGNTGIQSSTVIVRAIAMRRISPRGALAVIAKEAALGLLSGLGVAALAAGGIYLLFRQEDVALIFAAAMVFTMTTAGLAGACLPLLLKKCGVDPAITSGIFLTTVTDMVGFFSFLGLAAWMA